MRVLLIAFATLLVAAGCGAGAQVPVGGPSLDAMLAERPRLLWVAAHPDDESMAAGLLARACIQYRSACHFVVLNRGRGGECCIPEGCHPDLGTVRHQEMLRAARIYGATLEHYDLFNAPLPVSSFPSVAELERRWEREGDPAGWVARAIRRFRPDWVVTLDAYHGFTGHPEHRANARLTLQAAQLAADPDAQGTLYAAEPPHRVRWVVQVQNKYWFMALVGLANDPMPYADELDATVPCALTRGGDTVSCSALGANATRVHRSQDGDMRGIRAAEKFWGSTYVRLLDPFGQEAQRLVAATGVEEPQGDAVQP